MTTPQFPNNYWSALFIEQLYRCGLRAVCVAPGSRSTPLTLAFDRHPGIELFLHLDERSASFFALGLIQATGRPVAVVCTSGTAAAEFHPAIVEAFQAQLPLLVLTADRPPELRESGANQTIDQVKMFGDHVLWAVDAPLPQADAPAIALNNLHSLASRTYATADGLQRGPVHVNFPFRKPLEPESMSVLDEYQQQAAQMPPVARMVRGVIQPTDGQLAELSDLIREHERGIIVCGPYCPRGDFPAAVAALARRTGYPIFADPLSGVRFGPQAQDDAGEDAPIVASYESFLAGGQMPSFGKAGMVLRFGAVPTSKWLNDYLLNSEPAHLIHVRSNGVWADDSHRVTWFLQTDEVAVCNGIGDWGLGIGDWADEVMTVEQATVADQEAALGDEFIDASVMPLLLEALPEGSNLVVGNSLPIRHLDQFGTPLAKDVAVYGNRGASGIDGVTSTALGVAAADRSRPTVLLIGDVSFFHDMNGLEAIRRHGLTNVTVVLLNNDGGSIFRRLPVNKLEPSFTPLFLTPHGLNFEQTAKLYGLQHTVAGERDLVGTALAHAIGDSTNAHLVEIPTDGARDDARRKEIVREIRRLGD